MVEVLGRYVPAAKAVDYTTALNLKLVYLVTNPQAPNLARGAANWMNMTDEQRHAYVQQQAQRLLSMDRESRIDALASLMDPKFPDPRSALMGAVFERLPMEERVQFKQAIGARVDREAQGRKRIKLEIEPDK
jgi:hypothetical protein